MTPLNRKIISPKSMIAAAMVASFVFTSALSHAGEKKHPKKTEQKAKAEVRSWDPEKKSPAKVKKKGCQAPRKDKKNGAARLELGDLPCDK